RVRRRGQERRSRRECARRGDLPGRCSGASLKSGVSAPEYGLARLLRLESSPVNDMSVPPIAESVLADAEHLLLAPSGLDHHALSRVLAEIHTHDMHFADLYFQHARFEGWSLEE